MHVCALCKWAPTKKKYVFTFLAKWKFHAFYFSYKQSRWGFPSSIPDHYVRWETPNKKMPWHELSPLFYTMAFSSGMNFMKDRPHAKKIECIRSIQNQQKKASGPTKIRTKALPDTKRRLGQHMPLLLKLYQAIFAQHGGTLCPLG